MIEEYLLIEETDKATFETLIREAALAGWSLILGSGIVKILDSNDVPNYYASFIKTYSV